MSKGQKDSKEGALQIYARVRQLMPWEPKKISLQINGDCVQNKTHKVTNEYNFKKVFRPNSTNKQVFQNIAIPMIGNVLKGFNAVLIAYGQTGSGKTFSMLGKPKLNIVGILPMMLDYMIKSKQVDKVELSAVEAFGHHVAKIELFDLFDPWNQVCDWNEKKGDTGLELSKANKVRINNAEEAHSKIVYAHSASHFAPTGKNPESSRGHCCFIASIYQSRGQHENLVSHFVMVDCAGSEGETAFTKEFKARVSKQALTCRRLEAGVINTGLSQLQVIFNQLRTKGQLSKAVGNGLRKVLHPYINTNTYLSVLFTLSPSVNNSKATESTLKFAVTAGMVKVKPVVEQKKTDFKSLAQELKAHAQRQIEMIDENDDKIAELKRKIERTKKNIVLSEAGKGRKIVKKKVKKIIGWKHGENGEMVPIEAEEEIEVYEDIKQSDKEEEEKEENLKGKNNKKFMSPDDEIKELLSKNSSLLDDESVKKIENECNKNTEKWKQAIILQNVKNKIKAAKRRNKELQAEKIRKSKGIHKISQDLMRSEEQYKQIQKRQKEILNKLNTSTLSDKDRKLLESHATDLYVMGQEQEAVVKQLQQSREVIMDYLKADGREALVKYFIIRTGVLPNKR